MGRTACTEPQCLYKGDLYLFTLYSNIIILWEYCRIYAVCRLPKRRYAAHDCIDDDAFSVSLYVYTALHGFELLCLSICCV